MHLCISFSARTRIFRRRGGSRVYYHNLYRRLDRECGQKITVLTKRVPGWEDFDRAEQAEGFRILRRDRPLESWKYYRVQELARPLLQTLTLLRSLRPDILHAGDLYPQGLIALLAKRFFGYRYIAYCHGEEVTQMERLRTEPRLRDLIYRHADRVICASAFAKKMLLGTGIAEGKIEHITPGVDAQRFEPGPPRREIVERFALSGKLVLLTVARLIPRKGHRRVMAAVATLAKKVPNICYLIAGTGPEEESLRAYARELGVAHLVQFAGYVPEEELLDYYRACDVMAMPNSEDVATGDIEGFGMVFLEANAAGKPVVAGRSGGAAEPVVEGRTGFLVEPNDPAELAGVLLRLACDRELRESLGRQGAERARMEFDWSTRAKRLCECSEEVLRQAAYGGRPAWGLGRIR
ncbi:MAG: glycosyltransferase family 4 protein [Acidobacteriota bacterium]|nr:glycosyltransferase family 4 protein [Acidobacteriota bacterium]